MVATVITPEKFEELRQQKVVSNEIGDIELDPVAGNVVIGELTLEERGLFNELIQAEDDLDDWDREIRVRSAKAVAENIGESEGFDDLVHLVTAQNLVNKVEAEEFFELNARHAYVKSMFWYNVRHRLQTFATRLSIRAGYKVCNLGPKIADKEAQ